jgi:UDP-N-acetylglucosamine 4,6-dehydratase
MDDMYIIQPSHPWWKRSNWIHARQLPEGFRYASDSNDQWLSHEQLQELLDLRAMANAPVAV